MTRFDRLSLAQRFSLLSFFLIFGAMFVVAAWTGQQIENGVIRRTGAMTALYVDSLISHHLQDAMAPGADTAAHAADVQDLMGDSPLGRSLAGYKIWSLDGHILYGSQPGLVGRQFPLDDGRAQALNGSVHAAISDLSDPEETYERQHWSSLIETYAPLSGPNQGEIVGIIEFYQTTDALLVEIRAAQLRSWLVLGIVAAAIYLLLARLVFRASGTIQQQQGELQEKVSQLTTLLGQNEQLHLRVSRAAARTTALNERFLRRISADLHDGPGQDLALALLRIDELAEICESCRVALQRKGAAGKDFQLIRTALRSALTDLRTILAGLRLPEIDTLTLGQTAERAVGDFERKTGTRIAYSQANLPEQAPLSVKITLYRLLQEALSNGYRHANGSGQSVRVASENGELVAEVTDNGHGFDPQQIRAEHLGLAGMRERVEILGGIFDLASSPDDGTLIRARLPLEVRDDGID